ncbi:MAG: formate dehydrogenase [Wenzhouxiangella sp.]|nr:MAG: formate dehydrogenase [Wenzhouxiangella sp.]
MKQANDTSPKQAIDLSRRRLMTGALGAGAAAGLGLVSINGQAAAPESAKPEAKSTCYRETEHVRRYYDRARF